MDNEYDPPRQRKKPKVKESIIDHTYRDYSQVEVSSDDEATTAGGDDKKQSRLQPNFPAKLHEIVSNQLYQNIICWQPHGRSWKIVDKHLLSTLICPKHFAHAKFESFNRSVNGWGFKRLLNPGPDCKSYYHECFLRGRPELTKLMQRLVNPGKRLPDKAGEPDFYEISRKYPLPEAPTSSTTGQDVPGLSGLTSPHHTQRPTQPSRGFSYPPSQTAGYPYPGYGFPPGYPQLPSPASGYVQYPPQPTQQNPYWPNQIPPSGLYPPNPSAYGYYPYPQIPQMMAQQGYDPQTFQHSMYAAGQYYPGTPGAAYANPASPGRALKTAAAQSQQQPGQLDEHGQYPPYPAAVPRPGERPASTGGEILDERKPPAARTGLKRPLEEARVAGPGDVYAPRAAVPSHHLGGLDPSHQAAAAAAAAARSQEGAYLQAAARSAQEGVYSQAAAVRSAQEGGYSQAAAVRSAQEGAYNQAAAVRSAQEGAYNQAAAVRSAQEGGYSQAAAVRSAQEGVYNQAAAVRTAQEGAYGQAGQYGEQHIDSGAAGAAATAAAVNQPSEGSNTATTMDRQAGVSEQEEGGDGINDAQLLQDFFTRPTY